MPTPLDFGPFLSLSEGSRAELLRSAERAHFDAGATVVAEGDAPDAVFAIVAGRIRVSQGAPPIVLATPSAPVLVGEIAVVSGGVRSATVVSITQLRAYRIAADAIRRACEQEPEFARELAAFSDLRASNNFLRSSSPFADLPADAIESLAAKLTSVTFAPGDVILREGERGDDAYLIRDGEVLIHRGERELGTNGPGSFIGEVAALTGSARTATVRAKTHVAAFRVSGEDVRPIVKKHAELVARLEGTMQARYIPHHAGKAAISIAPDDPSAVIVRDNTSGHYLRLARDALAMYEDIDGQRSLRDLALRHFQRTGALDPAGVFATIAMMQAAGLVTAPRIAGDEPASRVMRIADLLLAPRVELRDADRVAGAMHRALRWAFTGPGATVAVVLGVVGLAALFSVFRHASPTDFGLGGIVVAFAGLLLAGIGHEMAHAIATKAEGRRVGRAGIGLIWFTPVAYVDTSDAWLIPRLRRIRVNAAGPLFNFAFAGFWGIVALVARGTTQDLAIWLAVLNIVSVIFNLSPLLEFDGYYVLEDLANVNALRRKSLRFVFHDLPALRRLPATRLETGFLLYAASAFVYVLAVTALVMAGVPAIVTGILGEHVAADVVPLAGVVLAVVLAALQVGPFVTEVLEARARREGD